MVDEGDPKIADSIYSKATAMKGPVCTLADLVPRLSKEVRQEKDPKEPKCP